MLIVSTVLAFNLAAWAVEPPAKVEGRSEDAPQVQTGMKAAGTWRLTALATVGSELPQGGGTIVGFGETFATQSFIAFWVRTGPTGKDWAIWSWKDGKLTKVAREGVSVATPDRRTISLRHLETHGTRAGRTLLYLSQENPEHVYAWDGDRLINVLVAGDTLPVGGVPHQIKRATLLDIDEAGHALLYWDSNKPHAEGWAIHDGATFKVLWKEGDPLPGIPEVRIRNMSSGLGCIFDCVPAARLLSDGSLLAVVSVIFEGQSKAEKTNRFVRISADRTETLLKYEGSPTPYLGVVPLAYRYAPTQTMGGGTILAAQTGAFIMDAMNISRVVSGTEATADSTGGPGLLLCSRGKVDLLNGDYDDVAFTDRESPRLLISRRAPDSLPRLDFYDGRTVHRVAWESAVGMDEPEALRAMETPSSVLRELAAAQIYSPPYTSNIALRSMSDPAGVRVDLPAAFRGKGVWFVPSSSEDGSLVQAPKLETDQENVTAADVLRWTTPNEAWVGLEKGIYLMRRSQ